jgi:hypothetical protein
MIGSLAKIKKNVSIYTLNTGFNDRYIPRFCAKIVFMIFRKLKVYPVILVIFAVGLVGCTSKTKDAPLKPPPILSLCPLTGAPPLSGAVPDRPALAVKIDNYPSARPQLGLMHADIVYEEPVEGMITRYVAVFQCQNDPLVGPIRSARAIDVGILSQLSDPIFIHAGGINPVISLLQNAPIKEDNIFNHTQLIINPKGRYAPYDTYLNIQQAYQLLSANDSNPPSPIFDYSSQIPQGNPINEFNVDFSSYSDINWTWDSKSDAWLRSYLNNPDTGQNGNPIEASNVIVQFVHISYGPWVENSEGALEVQANLVSSGKADIFRNGEMIPATWTRSSLTSPTQFNSQNGPITLAPGNTWVELLPDTLNIKTLGGTPLN